MSAAAPDKIIYEHPLNEKMRTLLRLEHLFLQIDHHLPHDDVWSSRAAVACLLDMVAIFGRADIKSDLLKELDRQRNKLADIRQTPGIDIERLDQILAQLGQSTEAIYRIDGQIGQALRSNEFLKSIAQRSSIPGGTCAFDLPQYHFWLEQPAARRQQQIGAWLATLAPIEAAVQLLLSLVRSSTNPSREVAQAGFFQQSLDTQSPAQLIRVGLQQEIPLFAEISGGKHRFTVRFIDPDADERPAQVKYDVEFQLNTCIL